MATETDLHQLTGDAILAVDNFAIDNRTALAQCSQSQQNRLIVMAAIGFLLGEDLISVAPADESRWLEMGLKEPYLSALAAGLEQAVASHQAVLGALPRAGLPR